MDLNVYMFIYYTVISISTTKCERKEYMTKRELIILLVALDKLNKVNKE